MAGCTVVNYPRVIKSRAYKGSRNVADRAILDGWHMIKRFADGAGCIIGPIVARLAIGGDTRVVKNCGNEFRSRVANVTILGSRQVV